MKSYRILVCSLCMTLMASGSLFAQDDPQEAEHEALRGIKAAFENAVNNNQMELIEPFLDKDFSVVTFTDREFSDFEKFKERWQKTRTEMLEGGTYSIKLVPDRSQIIGDIAITKGNSENVMINGNGQEFKFSAHWTAVCRKTDGKWRILRGHNSLDPFGNPMLKSGVKKMIIKTASVASVIGICIGLAIGTLIGRRKR
jgi:ketosteroid isomerase-like protein